MNSGRKVCRPKVLKYFENGESKKALSRRTKCNFHSTRMAATVATTTLFPGATNVGDHRTTAV